MKTNKPIATGKYNSHGLTIPVNVQKIRNTYGKIRYTITPQHGTGTITCEGVILDKEYQTLLDNLI